MCGIMWSCARREDTDSHMHMCVVVCTSIHNSACLCVTVSIGASLSVPALLDGAERLSRVETEDALPPGQTLRCSSGR